MAIAAPKTKEAVEEVKFEVEEVEKRIYHVYREMAMVLNPRAEGAWLARDIEGYLDGLMKREGWTKVETNVIGVDKKQISQEETEDVLRVLYILTK